VGNMHPPIAMRVKARIGLDRFFPVESADFGEHFRDMLGQTYSGAHARSVIVVNNDESLFHMPVGACGQAVTIPSIMAQNST